jgi:hypothetical protein
MAQRSLAVDDAALSGVRSRIEAFTSGGGNLTGLDLYYLLERSTPLLGFHTALRHGPRNRTRSGLQQSYGDHNRLLLLGLDKLVEGDLEWYRSRLESEGCVTDDRLTSCFDAVRRLDLDRPTLVALWLGAALHDCGMLGGHQGGLDVEDGVALASSIVDALSPADGRGVAIFAIRHHDFIKEVFRGEVPPAFIADDLGSLPQPTRATALTALGMIQVAGSASLGEGRLSAARVSIFERCAEGTALRDRSALTRLARLLGEGEETTDVPVAATAEVGRAGAFLERVPIHGWHRAWQRTAAAEVSAQAVADAKMASIDALAGLWAETDVDHVALAPELVLPAGGEAEWRPPVTFEKLANGARALVVG